ncbi:Guanylate kinase [Chlamydiales bacterium STE3]|nr:Guanylate kinase [Chlamydiales bacterium STE3]
MSSTMALLGNLKRGLIFIVSAPAGTGKTTLVNLLTSEFANIKQSLSFTTRQKRPGEEQGVHYQFVTPAEFEQKIAKGDFLEYAKVHGHYYGTSRSWVEGEVVKGNHVILVIDTQGALQLKGELQAVFIFVKPPSLAVLRSRLLQRKTDSIGEIERRIEWARTELELIPNYDYVILNEQLSVAYQVLRSIIIAEGHKISYAHGDDG